MSCSSIDHLYYRSSHDGTTLWSLYQVRSTKLRIGKGQSSCILRSQQKIAKSSPLIWRLLSKCQIDGEDFVIFCGLLRKHELYYQGMQPTCFSMETFWQITYSGMIVLLLDKNYSIRNLNVVFFLLKHSVSYSSIDHLYYRSSHDGTTLWSLYQVREIVIRTGYYQDMQPTCFSMENFVG